jgi:hypothetical protein
VGLVRINMQAMLGPLVRICSIYYLFLRDMYLVET